MRLILRFSNAVVSFVVAVILCMTGAYAAYALWDNSQIYAAVDNVQADMLQYKPTSDNESGASFEELLEINPDVCAWLTLDGTGIDYPVLQGETNLTYINTNVYGEFALAGSIYLDTRNNNTFSDPYSLLYGHHMDNSKMFGDLDLYEDESFFRTNTTGTLILPDKTYELKIFAYLSVPVSDENIFNTDKWTNGADGLITYTESNALYINNDTLNEMKQTADLQIIALSTCASGFTDARTVVLAWMVERQS